LVKEVEESYRELIFSKNAEWWMVTEKSDILIYGNKIRLRSVLNNLMDNSFKYAGESPKIIVHLSEKHNNAIVLFRDNGPGIPDEYLDKVFEKFFRVPSDDHHDVKGYGLGLSYVAQVMKEHGGSVTVKNLSSGGCEFTLKFPGE